jgi:predicted RNA-binding protein YlxR (DUF448 family)
MIEDLDKQTYKLIDKYIDAYEYLMKKLIRSIENNLSETHTRAVMAEIESVLKELDEDAYKYCTETLPQYFLLGVESVDVQVSLLNLALAGTPLVVHKFAIDKAVNDTYNDLAGRTKYIGEEMKKTIRKVSSEIITRQLITGESKKTVKKTLREELEAQGVHSFVDNANRKWHIGRYSNMLLRTKSRILTNEGTMERLKVYQEKYPSNDNFDFVQISNHHAKDWCSMFEGRVFSISGNSDIYPSVDRLPNGYSTLHPNCKHIFQPYIPELRGQGKIVSEKYLDRDVAGLNKEFYHLSKKGK